MNLDVHVLLWVFCWTIGVLLAASLLLTAINKSGAAGRKVCDLLAVAPLLDLVVFAFTHGPWVGAWVVWWRTGDRSLGGFVVFTLVSIAAQMVGVTLWGWVHELIHLKAARGPRILKVLNKKFGRVRNHTAVWWTALVVPVFTMVRIGELVVYPPLTWLVRLPKYRTRDWVNVSRQKFDGLVGHDLIWCLYCDWMTGVWSLGTEMLRNVESFWCPIRFLSPEKCKNCSIDFPDVETTWVGAPGSGHPGGGGVEGMAGVANLLDKAYPGPGGVSAWHGHPVRLTVRGEEPRNGAGGTGASGR